MTVERGRQNRKLYPGPPTWEQIYKVCTILKMKPKDVESLWGIPEGTMKRVKYSGRKLPARYWNWFYCILIVYDGLEIEGITDGGPNLTQS